MGSGDQAQRIVMAEGLNCVSSEEVPCASCRHRPTLDHLGVRPKQVAHYSFLRHFSEPINFLQIIDLFDVGRQTSMHTEYFIVNHCRDCEEVEDFGESTPNIQGAILFDAFIVEAIDLSDQPRLMVTSQQGYSVFVSYFEREEEKKGLDAVSASVDVIAQKDVVGVGRIATDFEQLKEIVKLPVYISADGDWRSYSHSIGLVPEYIFGSLTKFLDGHFLYLGFVFDLLNDLFCSFPSTHNQITNLLTIQYNIQQSNFNSTLSFRRYSFYSAQNLDPTRLVQSTAATN